MSTARSPASRSPSRTRCSSRKAPAKAVTKLDLATYYDAVADVMLPHLRGRPVNMQRFPDGIDGMAFYEKKVPSHFPDWMHTVEVHTEDGTQRQVVVDDRRSLVYLAQQACITPHTWLCTSKSLEKPDQLVFDLDPSDDDLKKVRRATRMVGELLDDLGLTTYLKTTGSRGYHVLVPLRPAWASTRCATSPGAAARCWSRRRPTCSRSSSARPSAATGSTSTSAATPTARPRCRRTPCGPAARRARLHTDHVGRALSGEAGPVHRHLRAPEAGAPRLPVGRRSPARPGTGQGPEEAGWVSDADQVLAAAAARAEALASADAAALTALLHPEFRWASHTGHLLDRAAYVERNTGGSTVWRSQELEQVEVTVVGDTAVLHAVAVDTVRVGEEWETFRMPVTQVWVRSESGWVCLAGHAGPRLSG